MRRLKISVPITVTQQLTQGQTPLRICTRKLTKNKVKCITDEKCLNVYNHVNVKDHINKHTFLT